MHYILPPLIDLFLLTPEIHLIDTQFNVDPRYFIESCDKEIRHVPWNFYRKKKLDGIIKAVNILRI